MLQTQPSIVRGFHPDRWARRNAPEGGEARANFWWIKWPFRRIEDVGRRCNSAALAIPGIGSSAFAAKLRVGGAKQPLKIVAAAAEEVAHSATVHFP
jgi:hypothetical protein